MQELDLSLPLKLAMIQNSSYTNWFDLETKGLHLREGWDWRLFVSAVDADPR